MENLSISDMENYPIKWVCNYAGQKAIGICGKTQKIGENNKKHLLFWLFLVK